MSLQPCNVNEGAGESTHEQSKATSRTVSCAGSPTQINGLNFSEKTNVSPAQTLCPQDWYSTNTNLFLSHSLA